MSFLDIGSQPYKVWSCDRKMRKAVVASSLGELKQKGKDKLGYALSTEHQHLRAVLESDGTEIEDDVYFKSLEKDTVFLLLLRGEEWQPLSSSEAFRAGVDESDNPSGRLLTPETSGQELLNLLKSDIANLLLLTESQMEQVASLDVEELATSESERKTLESIREACDRIVTEKQEQVEKMELLRRLETRLSNVDAVDNFPNVGNAGRNQPVFESGPRLRHLLQEARSSTSRRGDNVGRRLRSRSPIRKRRRQQ